MIFYYIALFIGSCFILFVSGNWLAKSFSRFAHSLGWREFIVSFFFMSFLTSLPELLVGVSSAIEGIPELSFGNVIGQNIIHFTLALGLCAVILKNLDVRSKIVQITAWYTVLTALFPIALILDGTLSRFDGVLLIMLFLGYAGWLFSKREHFSSSHETLPVSGELVAKPSFGVLKNTGLFIFSGGLLVLSAQGIVFSAQSIASILSVPLVIIGLLVVGLGTALPETYFSIFSARHKDGWMVAGNLLGTTVVSSTLVLGIVALITPVVVVDSSPYIVSRLFLLFSAIAMLVFLRTNRTISRREGIVLFGMYVLYIIIELIMWRF